MDLVKELQARSLVEHTSADLSKIFNEKRTVYIGTDPTADSLHVGHLAWVVLMKRLADADHKVILLVGGGTGVIGDPKERGERPLKEVAEIDQNAIALEHQLRSLLGERADFLMVNNAEWLREVKLLDFLRDVGKHFTVNELVKRELIRRRLDDPNDSISYTEFTYSLLQAYDYRELNQRYGCDLQVGGSDQWTNILSGVDLIRKKDGREVFALSIPLITDAAGKKFGKSEGNAVWLNSDKTTPYQFYQFWLNVEDAKVIDYLKTYTFLSLEEIEKVAEEHLKTPGERLAQKQLATEVTRFVHGDSAPGNAVLVSGLLFGDLRPEQLTAESRSLLQANAPLYKNAAGQSLADVLVGSGLAASKREAREFVADGAVSLWGEKQNDPEAVVNFDDIAILKRGKRHVVVLMK